MHLNRTVDYVEFELYEPLETKNYNLKIYIYMIIVFFGTNSLLFMGNGILQWSLLAVSTVHQRLPPFPVVPVVNQQAVTSRPSVDALTCWPHGRARRPLAQWLLPCACAFRWRSGDHFLQQQASRSFAKRTRAPTHTHTYAE